MQIGLLWRINIEPAQQSWPVQHALSNHAVCLSSLHMPFHSSSTCVPPPLVVIFSLFSQFCWGISQHDRGVCIQSGLGNLSSLFVLRGIHSVTIRFSGSITPSHCHVNAHYLYSLGKGGQLYEGRDSLRKPSLSFKVAIYWASLQDIPAYSLKCLLTPWWYMLFDNQS